MKVQSFVFQNSVKDLIGNRSLQLETIPISGVLKVFAPFVAIQTTNFFHLPRPYHISMSIFQSKKNCALTMVSFIMPFNSIFFTIGQTSLPSTKETNDKIWTYFTALTTSTVCKVPVKSFGEINNLDRVMLFPINRLFLEIFT